MTAETNKFELNNNRPKNYVELTEAQKIENEIDAIRNEVIKNPITINKAIEELQKINEGIQKKDIDQSYKDQISAAFDRLTSNLEQNIKNLDEETARNEVKEIANLVHQSTNTQLARLKRYVQHPTPERPEEVQKGIDKSSNNLIATVNNATKDNNIVAKKIGERMEKLIS